MKLFHATSVPRKLAERIVLATQIYWVIIGLSLVGTIPIIRYYSQFTNYISLLSDYSSGWIIGLVLFSLIWNAPLFYLVYRYRTDLYIRAQRVRLFVAGRNWVILFFLCYFVLAVIALASRSPTQTLYPYLVWVGLAGVALGMFWILSVALTGRGLGRFLGKYGVREAVLVLERCENDRRVLRPRTSAVLFGELQGSLSSLLASAYPRLGFPKLGEYVSDIALALNVGDNTERKAVIAFLEKVEGLMILGRRKPLEAGNSLLREIDATQKSIPEIELLRKGADIHSTWNRGWFGSLTNTVKPYSEFIAIAVGLASLVAYLLLR